MALKLFNSMGKKIEDFVPIQEGFVGFYGCGPTVYNYAHIGNLRAYIFLDILDKTLTFLGYKIKHVMNITDIGHLSGDADEGEDKMVKTAEERHQSVLDVAKFYTDAFFNDIDRLNIRHADVICKATDHIQDMIELIKRLEKNGHTYMAGGNLYYDVSTFADYGKLAGLNLNELKEGAGERKVVVLDKNKRNPSDFVLWFTKSKFENQALTWASPWGRGYPGWHIECSAMSMKYLGEHFDIHTGGIDHIPVHHTNEIAQSEGATGKKWVNYWLHNEFLVVSKNDSSPKNVSNTNAADSLAPEEKMSKSKGNFLTLQSIIDKGYDALDYRFFLLGAHYRSQVMFSWQAMDSAKSARASLISRIAKIVKAVDGSCNTNNNGKTETHLKEFKSALENDLSTPQALSVLQSVIKDSSLTPNEQLFLIQKMDDVLGLKLIENAKKVLQNTSCVDLHNSDPESSQIEALIKERAEAKKNKNFALADKIRNDLLAKGITITDTPQGTVWKRS